MASSEMVVLSGLPWRWWRAFASTAGMCWLALARCIKLGVRCSGGDAAECVAEEGGTSTSLMHARSRRALSVRHPLIAAPCTATFPFRAGCQCHKEQRPCIAKRG